MNILAKKVYHIKKKQKFAVEYGYTGGKWNFRIGSFILLTCVPGGRPIADRIAEALHKAWYRDGKIDVACRLVINRLLEVRTLKDWKPERHWNGLQVQSPQVRG